jgi:hypothetical protein
VARRDSFGKQLIVVAVAFGLLSYACDPATDIVVTNGCPSSVWIRINGEEPPEELLPGEKITTQRVGKGATILWSKSQYSPVKILDIPHRGGPVVIGTGECR